MKEEATVLRWLHQPAFAAGQVTSARVRLVRVTSAKCLLVILADTVSVCGLHQSSVELY